MAFNIHKKTKHCLHSPGKRRREKYVNKIKMLEESCFVLGLGSCVALHHIRTSGVLFGLWFTRWRNTMQGIRREGMLTDFLVLFQISWFIDEEGGSHRILMVCLAGFCGFRKDRATRKGWFQDFKFLTHSFHENNLMKWSAAVELYGNLT